MTNVVFPCLLSVYTDNNIVVESILLFPNDIYPAKPVYIMDIRTSLYHHNRPTLNPKFL